MNAPCMCGIYLAQPSTIFGSPDEIVQRGVQDGAAVTGAWTKATAKAVSGKTSAQAINDALRRVTKSRPLKQFAEPATQGQIHGGLLGAADAATESADDALPTDSVQFTLLKNTIAEAVKIIEGMEILDPDIIKELEGEARKQGFTIAGITNERMLEVAQRELARQVRLGADLRTFNKFVAESLVNAGFVPANPSHVETIFRTNVMTAYNGGRAAQMQQPIVLRTRPFWQVLTVTDSRQRRTHGAVNRKVFRADDPAWLKAYPPFGFNCRCRVRSLPASYAGTISPGSVLTKNLPDPGFRSGKSSLGVGPVKPPEKKKTIKKVAKKPPTARGQRKPKETPKPPRWEKNPDGSFTGENFGLPGVEMKKIGSRWHLEVAGGKIMLPKRATFDHAEGILQRLISSKR